MESTDKAVEVYQLRIGVITFFRTRFPAKAYQDEKKPELFPLSQIHAS